MTTPWTPRGLSGGGGLEAAAFSPHDPNLILINCDMSGAYRTTDGGRSWQLLPWQQLTGCPFCAPVFHPQDPTLVFAAYSYAATLRVSRDAGLTWAPIGRGLPGDLRILHIHPRRPQHLLAGTVTGVFHSADGGQDWAPAAGITGQVLGIHAARSDAAGNSCVAATAEAVYRSTDGGVTWTAVDAGLSAQRVLAFAGASDARLCRLYLWVGPAAAAPADQGPWALRRSDDGGTTWRHVADLSLAGVARHGAPFLLASDAAPERLYAVRPAYSAADTVLRSDDAGVTWRSLAFTDKTDPRFNLPMNYITTYFLPQSLQGWTIVVAAVAPAHPDRLLFAHYCSLFLSDDGGTSWRAGETVPVGAAPKPSARLADTCWQNNGLVNTTTWNYYVDPAVPERHFICYTDLGLARSTDAGATWAWQRQVGPNTYELAFDPAQPGRIWAAFSVVHDIPNNNIVLGGHGADGSGCVGFTDDGGGTWREVCSGTILDDCLVWKPEFAADWQARRVLPATAVTSVILDPRSPVARRTLFASCWQHGVFCSEDGGRTWRERSAGLGAPGVNRRVCRLHLHPDGTLFCLVTGLLREGRLIREGVGLYRSRDAGTSWEDMTAALDVRWLTDYAVDPRDSRIVYLAVCDDPARRQAEGGLYKTTDGGARWTCVARKSSLHFSAILHPTDPDRVYLTLTYNDGVTPPLWLSRDAGATWQPFEDYPFCSAHRVYFDPADPGHIYVTTYGASVWHGPSEP